MLKARQRREESVTTDSLQTTKDNAVNSAGSQKPGLTQRTPEGPTKNNQLKDIRTAAPAAHDHCRAMTFSITNPSNPVKLKIVVFAAL